MKGGVMESQQGSGGISSSQASETVAGIAELATQAEVDNETDDARIVTPLKLSKIKRRMTTNSVMIGNLTLATSRSSNAETISIKTMAGTDPSSSDPVYLAFEDGAGGFSVVSITSALSLTISSGSTLGATSGEPFRIWVVLFNDAGTFRLGAIKCYTGTGIVGLEDNGVASSTAEGGAGAADSAGVFYTGTAVTSKPYRILGRLDYTLTTAGTWVTAPTIKLFSQGSKLPGDVVQRAHNPYSAVATGATTIPIDDTIPQKTEGDQYMVTPALVPTAAANLLAVKAEATFGSSATNTWLMMPLFRDSASDCFAVGHFFMNAFANAPGRMVVNATPFVAGSTASTVVSARAGVNGDGTTTFNGVASARQLGAANKAFISIEEIMV